MKGSILFLTESRRLSLLFASSVTVSAWDFFFGIFFFAFITKIFNKGGTGQECPAWSALADIVAQTLGEFWVWDRDGGLSCLVFSHLLGIKINRDTAVSIVTIGLGNR